MTTFKCLATGSSGNCYLINLGGGCIILDAGISVQKIVETINLNAVIFTCISHEHKDHSKSMDDLKKRGVKVFYGGNSQSVHIYKFASHTITQIPIHHGDCINSAFVIQWLDRCVLYATDFTLCEYDLSEFKFNRVIVECNYLDDIVKAHFKHLQKHKLPKDMKVLRQINTHMGLKGLQVFLDKLDLSECKEIDLIHMSQGYGREILMGSSIYSKYKIPTCVCKQFGGVSSYGRK